MADKAPCAYGVSGYVVVEKTQPARGGAGPTDEELAKAMAEAYTREIHKHDKDYRPCAGKDETWEYIREFTPDQRAWFAAVRVVRARLAPGATDEALTILATLRGYAQKRQDVFTGTTNQLEWSAWQRVIDLANDAARRLAPGAPERPR